MIGDRSPIRDRAWIPDLSGPNVEQASLAVATRSALGRGRWMTPRASRDGRGMCAVVCEVQGCLDAESVSQPADEGAGC